MTRLIAAELLKLRKRRGLLAATLGLVVAPVAVAYAVIAALHAVDPAGHQGAGGTENFTASLDVLAEIGLVGAIIVGVTAGAGDLGAGVFRELVVTGRSRLSLFVARVPGGLAYLAPFVLTAFALAAVVATTVPGPDAAPGAGLLVRYGAWLLLAYGFAFAFAAGVGSAIGSRGISIGVVLGWQLAISPILLATGKLDFFVPQAALDRLQPAAGDARFSVVAAALLLAAWTALALGAGAWRTIEREA